MRLTPGPLLEVEGLARHYVVRGRVLRAVDGISFNIYRGECLALVGESGCGKSTTARLVMRLIDPTAGIIRFEGADITDLRGQPMRRLRRRLQMVFQDPMGSLNPRMTVQDILEEPLIVHERGSRMQRRARVNQLLGQVGLDAFHAARTPNAFSGGQRQRIGIARALAAEPALLVCDEPVSALDVSIQAQIVNLLKELQARLHLGILFIAHDLAVVRHVADRVAVMYAGRIVEIGAAAALFADPRHPYTRSLLAAAPRPDPHHRPQASPPVEPPAAQEDGSGCRFAPRCPFAIELCRTTDPALTPAGPDDHAAACHRAAELPPLAAPPATTLSPAASLRLALYAERLP